MIGLIPVAFLNEEGGDPNDEFVEFSAFEDVDTGEYAILDKTFSGDAVSNLVRHFYPLPKFKLKKGQFIRIYTGKGQNKWVERSSGLNGTERVYYCYWGLDKCIWNNNDLDDLTYIHYTVLANRSII